MSGLLQQIRTIDCDLSISAGHYFAVYHQVARLHARRAATQVFGVDDHHGFRFAHVHVHLRMRRGIALIRVNDFGDGAGVWPFGAAAFLHVRISRRLSHVGSAFIFLPQLLSARLHRLRGLVRLTHLYRLIKDSFALLGLRTVRLPKSLFRWRGLDSVRFDNADPGRQNGDEKSKFAFHFHSFGGVGVIISVAAAVRLYHTARRALFDAYRAEFIVFSHFCEATGSPWL